MNIYKNFLQKEEFNKLKNFIMGNHMPWHFVPKIVSGNEKDYQFEFCFIIDGKINCTKEMINVLDPILKKLKFKKLNKIKANLLTKDIDITEHGMHIDQHEGKTGIFYINKCNGYTKFKNGKKVISEENKYVEFDSSLKHTGSSCTDEKRRVVINFNYQ